MRRMWASRRHRTPHLHIGFNVHEPSFRFLYRPPFRNQWNTIYTTAPSIFQWGNPWKRCSKLEVRHVTCGRWAIMCLRDCQCRMYTYPDRCRCTYKRLGYICLHWLIICIYMFTCWCPIRQITTHNTCIFPGRIALSIPLTISHYLRYVWPRAKDQGPRAKGQGSRAKGQGPRAKAKGQGSMFRCPLEMIELMSTV